MVKITMIFIAWLCFVSASGQRIIEKHIGISGKESLSLKLQIADSIRIQTWDRNEVYLKGSVNVNDNKDNDAYVTSFNEDGKTVSADARFSDNYFKGKKNCCNESEITWQVFMPEGTALTVETINGNITITGKTGAIEAKSISGYIDLAVPATKAADIELSTISGRMYSDLDLNTGKEHSGIPMKISDRLNRGGDLLRLTTISGDIFFRKSD